jgi:hypothetical protein
VEQDVKLREGMKADRLRIANKMMNAKNGGAAAQSAQPKPSQNFHCETIVGLEE